MATARPFAYYPGGSGGSNIIPGTSQTGSIAVGVTASGYNSGVGGVRWWNGPDEDLGYIIGKTVPAGNQPNPDGVAAYLGFLRSSSFTDSSFVSLTNYVANGATAFTNTQGNQAKDWLNSNGYWTSYLGTVSNGLVIQLDADNTSSYPGTGATVYDITGSYNHTLTSAPYTVLNGVKCFDTNGTSTTIIEVIGTGPTLPTTGYTYITWGRIRSSSATWRTLFRTLPNDHPILVEINTDNLGFYDNDTNSFRDSGYDVSSIEDVWVQYTVVGDNSSSIFYINETQVGTVAYGAGGNRHWAWGSIGTQPFGYVANMYYYNRKLSLSEITQQYTFLAPRFITPSPSQTNLIMSWDIQQSSSYSGSGTTITDLKGNSNGTITGTITYTSGKPAYLTIEGGVSEYIYTANLNPYLSPVNTGTSQSVFLWIYPTSNGIIYSEQGNLTPDGGWYDAQIQRNTAGNFLFAVWPYSLNTPLITSPLIYPLNEWYYVGWTYSSNSLKAYVNGRNVGSATITRQTPYNNGGNLPMYFNLGYPTATDIGNTTNCTYRLGAMQVYNTGLSADSVLANYNATKFSYVL
jgi:hypothetical protein